MDGKIFTQLRERLSSFDEKSIGIGFAGGIIVTLGLSLLVPDTARQFIQEARGRLAKHRNSRHPHGKRDEQDRFFAEKIKEDGKEVSEPGR